jgi:hypothetical protein
MGDFGLSSLFGPLMGLMGNAISGNKGGGNVTGGVAPQQAALAEYEGQQRQMANDAKFAQSSSGLGGMGASTMKTYANAASDIGTAKQLAGFSDTAAQQQSQLQQLAQQSATQSGLQPATNFGNTENVGGNSGNTDNTPVTSG